MDFGLPHFDSELDELAQLALTAGLQPVTRLTCNRKAPDAALFVGSGKAEEIKELALLHGATEVLFDQALSPAQQRNLERVLGLPVNDRTMLILQIFAQRARSHEGKLQVELARLQYLSTRLVRRWSHLERQRGGPADHQVGLNAQLARGVQRPQPVDRAGRAGDADHQSRCFRGCHSHLGPNARRPARVIAPPIANICDLTARASGCSLLLSNP